MMNRKLKTTELNRISVDAYKNSNKTPIKVVLDNVRSLNNIGSVFRSSDAFLISEILLCGITAKPPHKDIQKTALGSTDSVDWRYFEKIEDALDDLKKEKYQLIAVEQTETTIPLNEFQPKSDEKYALIFGNEVNGVQQQIIDEVDMCLEIPQYGTKHSLNISVCAGIVLWDLLSKIQKVRNT